MAHGISLSNLCDRAVSGVGETREPRETRHEPRSIPCFRQCLIGVHSLSERDERGGGTGRRIEAIPVGEPRQHRRRSGPGSGRGPHGGEVSQQAHQLGETLAAAGGIGLHGTRQGAGAPLPHIAVAADEELVAHVAPALGGAGLVAVRAANHIAGVGVVVGTCRVMYEEELRFLFRTVSR